MLGPLKELTSIKGLVTEESNRVHISLNLPEDRNRIQSLKCVVNEITVDEVHDCDSYIIIPWS
jgi:hypothetical protein